MLNLFRCFGQFSLLELLKSLMLRLSFLLFLILFHLVVLPARQVLSLFTGRLIPRLLLLRLLLSHLLPQGLLYRLLAELHVPTHFAPHVETLEECPRNKSREVNLAP